MTAQTIIDFKENPTSKNWQVVDDVVMGGRSNGDFTLTEDGYGKFSGKVSLENNGGFSSVRYDMETLKVNPKNIIKIRLKGDGKNYQFRIKARQSDYYSYITNFKTTGDWQTIAFTLGNLYPTFRGRRLDLPNFDKNTIEEIRFLIGNKKPQEFKLLLKSIKLMAEE
ncbi:MULTISPECIES: CIA30 family protein [unclassified Croceitalea]|uniref:CIA30 family protein n=1 Tax=unclassified Croceitalea TaxID=2632280 RepID=UPI0030D9D45F